MLHRRVGLSVSEASPLPGKYGPGRSPWGSARAVVPPDGHARQHGIRMGLA
jgi:hypothetical protein